MGRIWLSLMLLSAAMALTGNAAGETAAVLLGSGSQAVTLMMTLLATMTLWSGLMEILAETGDVARLGRVFRKLLRPVFPHLEDAEAWNAISLNLSANLLGLGNAATPAGIEAARRLAVLGEPGLRALGMLLVLDNSSLQLLPTTVMTLRQNAGARDPADIWGMTVLISGAAMVIAVVLMKVMHVGGRYGSMERSGHRRSCRTDHAAGPDCGL